jgi:hypothetical protein
LYDAYGKVSSGDWLRFDNTPEVEAEILASADSVFPWQFNYFSTVVAGSWVSPSEYRKRPYVMPRVFVPFDATPSPSYDGHLIVVQPDDETVFESYATIVISTGEIVCTCCQLVDAAGDGTGYQNSVSASMMPSSAGLLLDEDINSGVIRHALALLVPGTVLAPGAVLPALAFDRNTQGYSGTLPMGARLALDPGITIASLELQTAFGVTIATAAQQYGCIIMDKGGGGITILCENGTTDELSNGTGPRYADLRKIFEGLKHVVNNGFGE